MARPFGELEAGDSVDAVLRSYDATTDAWRYSFDSPFWKAVLHAQACGSRGRGERIALIDSGCRRSIPRLRARVDSIKSFVPGRQDEDPIGHGTAVALLLSEIAPESRIDVYRVATEDGRVDLHATVAALRAAAASSATVVNLSLGDRRELEPPDSPELPRIDPLDMKRQWLAETPPCPVCEAADAAVRAGKLVFAAVGNSVIDTYCPSRVPEVFAIGFQRAVTVDLPGGRTIVSGWPALDESPYADFFVPEVQGVVGSSFACPLYAGVGALGIGGITLRQYARAFAASAAPKHAHALIDQQGGPMKIPRALGQEVEQQYKSALSSLPHVHSAVQAALRPDLPRTDPASCPFCGIFAEALYVTAGLWLCETERYNDAISLLEAACALAPWSAQARFHLGMSYHLQEDGERALLNYRRALELRPGYPDVVHCLRNLLGVGATPGA